MILLFHKAPILPIQEKSSNIAVENKEIQKLLK